MKNNPLTFGGKKVIHDSKTGREIWQMTSGEFISHAPYMYSRGFSHNEKYLVFSSDRTGSFQLYRMEVESGEARQLTDLPDYLHLGLCVDHSGREVYFTAGNTIRAVEIESGDSRVVADFKHLSGDQPIGAFPCLTDDDSRVLIDYHRTDGAVALGVVDAKGSKPEEVFVFPGVERVSHPNLCPGANDLITIDVLPDRQNERDLPPALRARSWKLNLRTRIAEPFLIVPPGFRATHEYWAPDGSRLYFHLKTVPGWVPASIASIPRDGGEITVHFTTENIKLGHSAINPDQTKIVSDSENPGENGLLLIDIAAGSYEILCWPNVSGKTEQTSHVHPAFSPSGRMILYTSDATGWAQVYIIPCAS